MSNILKNLRTWLQRGNNSAYAVFFLFAFILFLKTMIFHWSCFHSVLLSSLWKNPGEFIRFWGGKLVPILFISSFVFLTRRQWWTVVVSIFCDLWMIANMFYYKANNLFLSVETIKMADNMSGFWSSLLLYFDWDIVLVIILTILYVIVLYVCDLFEICKRIPKIFIIVIIFSMLSACSLNYLLKRFIESSSSVKNADNQVVSNINGEVDNFNYYYPFGHVFFFKQCDNARDYNAWCFLYTKDYSIISYFPACIIYSMIDNAGEIIELSESQLEEVSTVVAKQSTTNPIPKTNIIFILVESFESWPIDSICGHHYMPYLSTFINSEHVLYCDKLKTQTRHGNSADGQMIDVTGMLPISNGATCRLYGQNDYPNYAHFYNNSAIINPSPGTWQQAVVTSGYGFNELIEPNNGHWNDKSVLDKVKQYVMMQDTLFCVLGITISSHTPFSYGATNPKYEVVGMPTSMSAYLNCLSYADSCIESLMKYVLSSDLANNTTVVISGDHIIFHHSDADLDAFAKKSGFSFESGNTRTPLIIYSPLIEGNIHVTDECYQMDIFPTILHLIGCEDYYWHGFGVNLLDEQARSNRQISEQEAYRLSDLMIRSDYFRQYLKKSPQR